MPIAHTEGHVDCPACELNRIEAVAQPLTIGRIAVAILLGNLLTGVVTSGLYFAVKWLLWR